MTISSEFEFDRPTSAAQAIELATSILRSVGVDLHQIAFWRLSQHSKLDPANANIYEDALEVIEWRMTQPQPPDLTQTPATVALTTLTATQVGQMLTERYPDIIHPPSAQRVNQALEQLDFHSHNDKKVWQLTKLGQQHGRLISVTDEQDRTRLQVRWLPTVLDRLAPLFVSC
ncbi:hypothetical protein [Chamaesiphon sp.]|uniref:hypothetical protein n=1 Tax=Chamaesiphon sp. TaxID=2814140 RepID=UPI0035945E41